MLYGAQDEEVDVLLLEVCEMIEDEELEEEDEVLVGVLVVPEVRVRA